MPNIAVAWTDTRSWCRPRQEAGLDTRIAAVVGSRADGVAARGAAKKPGRAARSGPDPGLATRLANPERQSGKTLAIASAND